MTVRFDIDKDRVTVTQPSRDAYVIRNVHPRERCKGQSCVIHNPTDHPMSYWPLEWADDKGFSRKCTHGFNHPDPDGLAFWARVGPGPLAEHQWHSCDGCCGQTLPKLNQVRCGACKEVITSYSRHHFVTCGCGESFVDGGFDYSRRGGLAEEVHDDANNQN